MDCRFHTADVFTDRLFGGNPLAVFPDGRGIDGARMQRIAREFNLSETVFVLPPENPAHAARLRIFTPTSELPFAGHPTVGTAHILAATGRIALSGDVTNIVFEEGVGPVPVSIRAEGGKPVFAQLTTARLPEEGPEPPPAADLAEMLSLDPADVLTGADRPRAFSCGLPFLFLPLRDRAALVRARMRIDRWEALLSTFWAPDVFPFCYGAGGGAPDIHARMFSPEMGIPEDPATGSAVSAFAGYIAQRSDAADGTLRHHVAQGEDMGRPSLLDLEVDLRDGAVSAVRVGGSSVLVSEGVLHLP